MDRLDVSLEKGVGWECNGVVIIVYIIHGGQYGLDSLLSALRTGKAFLCVHSTLMGAKMARRIKRHWAFPTRLRINMTAWKRLLVQVYGYNVLLESRVLPKRLVAWRILGAAVFVPSIMCSQMTAQPRSGHETFPASWTITYVVSNPGVGAFYVVVEMGCSKKSLFATFVGAFEESFVIV